MFKYRNGHSCVARGGANIAHCVGEVPKWIADNTNYTVDGTVDSNVDPPNVEFPNSPPGECNRSVPWVHKVCVVLDTVNNTLSTAAYNYPDEYTVGENPLPYPPPSVAAPNPNNCPGGYGNSPNKTAKTLAPYNGPNTVRHSTPAV